MPQGENSRRGEVSPHRARHDAHERKVKIDLRGAWICLLAIAIVAIPGTAPAEDDAGSRSVFATAPGGRALGLGGAYVSLAVDANASLWNAGGLGFIQRNEIELSHARLGDLGFHEQHFALALPSWRWGTFGVALRHYGVGGIELRDERNVLRDTDLSDRQLEFSVAYGRALAPGVGLGVTAKLQQHSLAGVSDSGVGADLGLLIEPIRLIRPRSPLARRWTAGVSVRNVIEPSLRLDEESVPDPIGVRIGTAWRHPFGAYRWVLAAADIEKTREMDARGHLGLETSLLQALALRIGWAAGDLTAGFRAAWSGLRIDYSYEDSALDPAHRFAISWLFGSTLEERRLAADAREEQEIQERLEREYADRLAQEARELLDSGRERLVAGDLDSALDMVASARTLGADPTDADQLEADIRFARGQVDETEQHLAEAQLEYAEALRLRPDDGRATAALERVIEAQRADERRSRQVSELFETALAAFAGGRIDEAIEGFDQVLAITPDDSEAARLRDMAVGAQRERVESLVLGARAWIDAQAWTRATTTLDQLEAAAPEDPRLTELRERLQRKRQVAEREAAAKSVVVESTEAIDSTSGTASAGSAPRTLTESESAELESMYRRGMDAMREGRTDEALRYWEFVWSVDPDYAAVGELLEQEYLTRGMEHFAAGRLDEAIEVWTLALRTDPDDERTIRYLERAHEKRHRVEQIEGAR